MNSEANVASELKGNTLRVYWYLLKSSRSSVGPREVQRKMEFSSPALAVYHLDKLVELGLAKKVAGEYHVTHIVDVGVLKQFLKVKGFVIPRNVLYATMFAALFAFYVLQFRDVNFYSVYALILGLLGTVISIYETVRAWRSKP